MSPEPGLEESLAKPSTGSSENTAADPEPADQLEDLRVQNAVLRKSLAMLQQSVVDSMKSERGQFMGNGIFKKGRAGAGGPPKLGAPPMPPAPGGDDADLESLRAALAERRTALKVALAQRDTALEEAKAARREVEAAEQLNRQLSLDLADASRRLGELDLTGARLEEERAAAAARSASLDAQLAGLREEVGALQAALRASQEKVTSAEAKSSAMQQELQALHSHNTSTTGRYSELVTELEALKREREAVERHRDELASAVGGLQICVGSQGSKLERLAKDRVERARKLLCSFFGGSGTRRLCFEAWSASCLEARQARLSERIDELESAAEGLDGVAAAAREARDAAVSFAAAKASEAASAREEAAASASEAAAAREEARQAFEALAASRSEGDALRRRADELDVKAGALEKEVQRLRAAAGTAQATITDAEGLREATERAARLQRELDAAGVAAKKAAAVVQAQLAEAGAREATLKKEADTAAKALAKAKEAEAAALRQRDAAREKAAELELEHKEVSSSLQSARNDAQKAARDAREATARAEKAEQQVKTYMGEISELQKRLQEREAHDSAKCSETDRLAKEHAAIRDEASKLRASLEEARAKAEAAGAGAAEVTSMRLALAEARSEAKAAAEKLKLLRDEHAASTKALEGERATKAEADKLSAERAKFQEDARQAIRDAKQQIRLLVTAPKVAINIGNNERQIHVAFPFEAIKDAIQHDVVPKYSKVVDVSDAIGDFEIRKDVHKMVEQLAVTLQCKVCELMPQAEGTCNWDGFGSKTGTLTASKYM